MAQNTQQPLMGVRSAQDQLCALASQFSTLAGLGHHSDPELQRYLAIRITEVLRQELVQRGAIRPGHSPTIWEEGARLDLLEQSAVSMSNQATLEDEDTVMHTETMPDRTETYEEEGMNTHKNADQTYVIGLSHEVFAIELHRRILDASGNNNKTVEPQFTATLPMVERLGPLMVKALTTYWDEELRQAVAAVTATGERQAPQTLALAEYCRQPQILAERDNANDFEGAVKSIQNIVQDQQNATHARQGIKSWVWPLLQKYCINTNESKEVEIGNEELLYMALGEKFPKGYGKYKLDQQEIEAQGLSYQRPARNVTPGNKAATKWRSRRRNYYECLCWLRTRGHSWVFMVNVKNLDSLFGEIDNPEATFGPWIELLGSIPAELSSRAFSRANVDYSGRREMRLFENIPQKKRDEWNDHRVVWVSDAELGSTGSTDNSLETLCRVSCIPIRHREYAKTLRRTSQHGSDIEVRLPRVP